MEENTNNAKVTYAKVLSKLTFSSLLTSSIDSNANIKKVLDVCAYIYDEKIDCANGKAIINGKIGLKVLYIDTDNITNTTTSSQSFSETLSDTSLTNECHLFLTEKRITTETISTEGSLKISCEISAKPIAFFNLPLNTNLNLDNMVVKKSSIETTCIQQYADLSFDYTTSFETKDSVSKILSHTSHYSNMSVACFEDSVVVEGKLYSTLIYETTDGEETKIKQLTDCYNIKNDLSLAGINTDCNLEAFFNIDKSKETITTEIEDGNTIVNIVNNIKVCGVCTKNISLELVDDLYSIENETEITTASREYTKAIKSLHIQNSISSETSLNDDEVAIEEIVSNAVTSAEITNSYLKDGTLMLEGVITSNTIYLDENKQHTCKQIESPFIINTKLELEDISCAHYSLNVADIQTKAKRGTIIELEYELCITVCVHTIETKHMVDNIIIGKPINFSAFDYQIYLAKPNETLWELCKRTKTTPELLTELNKDLPLVLTGTEKIIVKR